VGSHVPHLFLPGPWDVQQLPVGERITHHLEQVLRISGSQRVSYTDGHGRLGVGSYESGLLTRGEERTETHRQRLTIRVAPPKNRNRVRFLVEKLAELEVTRLVWLKTVFTEGRPPPQDKARAWSIGALEQSRGCWEMEIGGPASLEELVDAGTLFVADLEGGSVDGARTTENPVLCVGPEGGFAADEVPDSAVRIKLAERVLRIETAAIAGAVLLGGR
jgi:16S rRNA (uracil1498-N3)-methyltransferase